MDLSEKQKKAIIYLTLLIGLVIAGTAIRTNHLFIRSLPPKPPSLDTIGNRTAQMVKNDLDNYRKLVDIQKDIHGVFHDLLVTNFLQGLFTTLVMAIIAYVFGNPIVKALAARIAGIKGDDIAAGQKGEGIR